MDAIAPHLDRLAAAKRWTYRASRESASEPAAWTAIALAAHGRIDAAREPASWLAKIQQPDGAVGVSQSEAEPQWPTSLAILAWVTLDHFAGADHFSKHVERAVKWSLADRGLTAPRSPEIGHDTTLTGWSWAHDTHSWLEPTCLFVLALQSVGLGRHSRTREGVRLVHDRLLPQGGANYGNTIVLGQPLLAHVQPTGLAMLALAGEADADGRADKSLDYLERSFAGGMAAASLSYACLGLTAHGRRPANADAAIASCFDGNSPALASYELALLSLAALSNAGWLVRRPANASTSTNHQVAR